MRQAAAMGRKMLAPTAHERLCAPGQGMTAGLRLNRLLSAQTGQRVLSLCPGAALFPCRMARNGQRVVFSTRAFMQEASAMLAMQASLAFAARACMSTPPLLVPMTFMGSPLLPETDVAFCARQLMLLGAHRVLVIQPYPSPRRVPDALDLADTALRLAGEQPLGEETAVLRVIMPETAGALSFEKMEDCCEAGRWAASQALDGLFDQLGMAFCRVLPFRRQSV